jgi:hypothetical protein
VKNKFQEVITLRKRIRDLENALRPFARFSHESWEKRGADDIFVPTEGEIWLYIGALGDGKPGHLHTDAFAAARKVMNGRI